ncbi:hypothetical protein [Bacillus pumilus]|uniref:hypothetical protein n=1 Tax=Bacillus pumilus TaxID=1408 RepID=UPI003305B293
MKLFKQPELFLVQDNGDAFSEGKFPTLNHAFSKGLYSYKKFYVVREVWDMDDDPNGETQRIKKTFEIYGEDKRLIGTVSDSDLLLEIQNSSRLGDTK